MLDQQLISYLRKVSPLTGERVYPLVLPEPYVLPAIVYQRTNTQQRRLHDGTSMSTSSIRLDLWTATYAEAVQVAGRLKAMMLAWQSSAGQTSRLEGENTEYEPGVSLYRTGLVFQVSHREEI